MSNLKTNQAWVGRQSALSLKNNRWEVSFLATSEGDITELGGQVAEFHTPKSAEATRAAIAWITLGEIPGESQTHAPYWFDRA